MTPYCASTASHRAATTLKMDFSPMMVFKRALSVKMNLVVWCGDVVMVVWCGDGGDVIW